MLGDKFIEMICASIIYDRFLFGITLGTIVFLFKVDNQANLPNWLPITLLNVTYKIVAKAKQIRLQIKAF